NKYSGNKEQNMISSNCTYTKYFTGGKIIKCWETYSWNKKLSLRFGSTTVIIKRKHKMYITAEKNKIIMTLSKSINNEKHWNLQLHKFSNSGNLQKKKIIDFSVRGLTNNNVLQTRSSYFTQLYFILPDFNLTISTKKFSLQETTNLK
ncbi:unnamed protein product, partial [Meganyctiphanes norvegica]